MMLDYAVFVRFDAPAVPFELAAGPLPDARTWVPYNAGPALAGGIAPLQFQVPADLLPPGFAVDPATGAVSGVTTQSGAFDLVYVVTDAFRALSQTVPLTVIESDLLLMTDNTPLLMTDNTPLLMAFEDNP